MMKSRFVRDWIETSALIMDTESQCPAPVRDHRADKKALQQFVHAGRIPLPLRRSHKFADVLKIALCFTAAA